MAYPKLYVALVHHPVLDRKGEAITSAVTNLDIHDIARTGATYGIAGFYVVTPLVEQQRLVKRVISHWQEGLGGSLNPDRRAAFGLVRVADDLERVIGELKADASEGPLSVIGTTARRSRGCLSWKNFQKGVCKREFECILLLFGTASGLHSSCLELCHHVLCPIDAGTGYNHLSVRSAVAIVLDRISRFQEAF